MNFSLLSAFKYSSTFIFSLYSVMISFNHRKKKENKERNKALYFNIDAGFHHRTTSLKLDVLPRLVDNPLSGLEELLHGAYRPPSSSSQDHLERMPPKMVKSAGHSASCCKVPCDVTQYVSSKSYS